MFSNKGKLATGWNNDFPLQPTFILSPPTGWTKWLKNEQHVSKLNWRQFFPCYNIQLYSTSILIWQYLLFAHFSKVANNYKTGGVTYLVINVKWNLLYHAPVYIFLDSIQASHEAVQVDWRATLVHAHVATILILFRTSCRTRVPGFTGNGYKIAEAKRLWRRTCLFSWGFLTGRPVIIEN